MICHHLYKTVALTAVLLSAAYQTPLPAQVKTVQTKGYGKASYDASHAGKFMKNWLVAGPITVGTGSAKPTDALQENAFREDLVSKVPVAEGQALTPLRVKETEMPWRMVSSAADIVDLDSFYKKKDFAYAYLLAEIRAAKPMNTVLAVGSDDAIKIWLNGKLVHENLVGREVRKDDDQVALKLEKGSNQLLMKVQDEQGGWALVARVLDKEGLSAQLSIAAGNGNLDKVKFLIDAGADVNAKNEAGITPIIAAKLSGRDESVQLLLKEGATDEPVPPAETLVDNMYKQLNGKPVPGIAVLVAKEGNILFEKGFGYADIKNKIPVTPETRFRIGSITKQFTAAAILKLQENNLLSVKDKLSKFIPDFPRGDEVTLHELLTHTSGIHSYTSANDFEKRVVSTITPDSLVSLIKKDPYDFNPGEQMLYNNSGYFLLGYIISRVSGKSYGDYLKETFFDPLGMKNTGVHYAGIKMAHEAKGYAAARSTYDDALNWDMSWAGAAGALYSTVGDLLKWNLALHGGKLLNETSVKAAITPVSLKNGTKSPANYGYGLAMSKYRGLDHIGHGGGLHGFISQLVYYPKEKLTIVMFSNTATPLVNFDPHKIAEAFLWKSMEKQRSYLATAAKPENLEVFTGRYEFPNVGVLTISTEEQKMYAQLSGQPRFEIFPASENEFFWKVVEARVKFFKSNKGEVDRVILYQNGQELTGNKLQEEKIVAIDTALLDKYTGKYKLGAEMVITVSRENNRLFAQATNQPRLEMSPVSNTDFVLKEFNAKLSFVSEPGGKVTRLKLNMNGTNNELPKIE